LTGSGRGVGLFVCALTETANRIRDAYPGRFIWFAVGSLSRIKVHASIVALAFDPPQV